MAEAGTLMAGKRGLITGVANEKSIAWGIARELAAQGAELAFTYQNDAMKRRVEPLAQSVGSEQVYACDVEQVGAIAAVADGLKQAWGSVDFVLHSLAYSDREELKGRYVDTSRENFNRSCLISCYSLTEMAQHFAPLMPPADEGGGAFLTLTFIGSQRAMPNYNVMGVAKAALEASVRYLAADLGPQGIRVNSLSAGPMRTISGAAIGGARATFNGTEAMAALRRNATLEEAGRTGLYLLSHLSSGVTGSNHFVDGGFHMAGLPAQG